MRLLWTAGLMLSITTTGLAAGDGDGSLFAGTLAQSIAAVIVFLILFFVLTKFAWGPILKGLQDREQKIKDDLQRAQTAAHEAAASLEKYQNQLADSQAEVASIIDRGRSDAQKIATALKEQAQVDVDQIRCRAEADIAAAKQQALNDIYSQGAQLATSVAGRILQREISSSDHQQLIDESIKTLGRRGL